MQRTESRECPTCFVAFLAVHAEMVAIRNATAKVTDQDRTNIERDNRHQNDEEQDLRLSGQCTLLIGCRVERRATSRPGRSTELTVFAVGLVGVVRTISITITDETSINAMRIREAIEATGSIHAYEIKHDRCDGSDFSVAYVS